MRHRPNRRSTRVGAWLALTLPILACVPGHDEAADDSRVCEVTILYTGFTGATVVAPDGPEFAALLEARFAGGNSVEPPQRGRLTPVKQAP